MGGKVYLEKNQNNHEVKKKKGDRKTCPLPSGQREEAVVTNGKHQRWRSLDWKEKRNQPDWYAVSGGEREQPSTGGCRGKRGKGKWSLKGAKKREECLAGE